MAVTSTICYNDDDLGLRPASPRDEVRVRRRRRERGSQLTRCSELLKVLLLLELDLVELSSCQSSTQLVPAGWPGSLGCLLKLLLAHRRLKL